MGSSARVRKNALHATELALGRGEEARVDEVEEGDHRYRADDKPEAAGELGGALAYKQAGQDHKYVEGDQAAYEADVAAPVGQARSARSSSRSGVVKTWSMYRPYWKMRSSIRAAVAPVVIVR